MPCSLRCLPVIQHPAFPVEPWALRETAASTSTCWPRPSRCSRCPTATSACAATSTRASRTACPAPTSTASTSCARCRTPRPATATPSPARRSSTSPTASSSGCWSTTSRSTCATASCARTSACSTCAPACCAATVEWVSPAGQRGARRARRGWSRSPSARSPRSLYEVEPLDEPRRASSCSPSWSPTSRCPTPSDDPRVAAALERAAACRGARAPTTRGACWCTAPGAAGCAWPRRWTTSSTGPTGIDDRRRGRPTTRRASTVDRRAGAGRDAAARQVPRLRLVEPALAAGAARPGRRRARRGPAHRLGRAARGAARRTSTTSGTRADVEIDGDAELQQAVRFALFHVLQAGARAERRAIPAKGLTGPGYDGHTFWDTETFVLPVLTYTAPERGARRAALAPLDARPRRASAPQQLGLAGRRVPVAHDPRRGVLGLLAGRHRRVPHQRRHRRRRRPLRRRPPATTTFEREVGLELLVETARLWRSLGHHDAARPLPHRRRHRPRRVHARSPTTTSTRT